MSEFKLKVYPKPGTKFTMTDDDGIFTDDVPFITLNEDQIQKSIIKGKMAAGCWNGYPVSPPVSEWPERFRALKTD